MRGTFELEFELFDRLLAFSCESHSLVHLFPRQICGHQALDAS